MVCAQQGLDFHVDFSPAAGEKLRDARAEGSLSANEPCSDQINCGKKLREHSGFCLVSGHCYSDTKRTSCLFACLFVYLSHAVVGSS